MITSNGELSGCSYAFHNNRPVWRRQSNAHGVYGLCGLLRSLVGVVFCRFSCDSDSLDPKLRCIQKVKVFLDSSPQSKPTANYTPSAVRRRTSCEARPSPGLCASNFHMLGSQLEVSNEQIPCDRELTKFDLYSACRQSTCCWIPTTKFFLH